MENQIDLKVSNLAQVHETVGRSMCIENITESIEKRKIGKQKRMESKQEKSREKDLVKFDRLEERGKREKE